MDSSSVRESVKNASNTVVDPPALVKGHTTSTTAQGENTKVFTSNSQPFPSSGRRISSTFGISLPKAFDQTTLSSHSTHQRRISTSNERQEPELLRSILNMPLDASNKSAVNNADNHISKETHYLGGLNPQSARRSTVSTGDQHTRPNVTHRQVSFSREFYRRPSESLQRKTIEKMWMMGQDIESQNESGLIRKSDPISHEVQQQYREEMEVINLQISSIMVKNFGQILETHNFLSDIQKHMENISDSVYRMETVIQDFQRSNQEFAGHSISLTDSLNRISRLEKFSNITVDFLSIPVLFNDLVKVGHYDEAIELWLHLKKLHFRHPDSIMLKELVDWCRSHLHKLESQLMAIIRYDQNLPVILKTIGYLRKQDIFTEMELRLLFLQEKASELFQMMYSNNDMKINELKVFIDKCRERLFDVVTQYRAAFGDVIDHRTYDRSNLGKWGLSTSKGSKTDVFDLEDTEKESNEDVHFEDNITYLLPCFIHAWLGEFIQMISKQTLKEITHLQTVYTQLTYFGLSAGRLGFDFRHVIADMVQTKQIEILSSMLKTNIAYIKQTLNVRDEKGKLSFLKRQNTNPFFTSNNSSSNGNADYEENEGYETSEKNAIPVMSTFGTTTLISPPGQVSDYLSLALILNSLLIILNQVRLLPILATADQQLELFVNHMYRVSNEIRDRLREVTEEHREWQSESPGQWSTLKSEMDRFRRTYQMHVVPFAVRGFQMGLYKTVFFKRSDAQEKINEAIAHINGIF